MFTASGVYVREGLLPPSIRSFRIEPLRDGRYLLNNYYPTTAALVLLDEAFGVVRTFGATTPRDSPRDSDALQHLVTVLPNGHLVSVQQNYRFRVEIWDTTGVRLQLMDEARPWFKPWTQAEFLSRSPRTPPFPQIAGAFGDSTGRLWIAAAVADRAWKPPAAAGRASGDRGREILDFRPTPVAEYDRAYDTILEIWDVRSGRVAASVRFDAYVAWLSDDGLLYSMRETPSGTLTIEVWQPRVLMR